MRDMHLYVTDEFYDWVRREAFEAKTSMSRLVVGAIREELERQDSAVCADCGYEGSRERVRASGRQHKAACSKFSI